MTQEFDYLEMYRKHYGTLIDRCVSRDNITLAFFWLSTYQQDLENDLKNMSPEMARKCIDHFSECRGILDRISTIEMIAEHFDYNKEKIERYLRRIARD